MWTFRFGFCEICVILLCLTLVDSRRMRHERREKRSHSHFTIEDLLSRTFAYTDPRTDNQIYMDPCKAGKHFLCT